MLSKELKELELNSVITRTVYDSTPVRVEYRMTDSGKNILNVLDSMIEWGLAHRKSTINADWVGIFVYTNTPLE